MTYEIIKQERITEVVVDYLEVHGLLFFDIQVAYNMFFSQS